jgi:hypothetical protein
MMKVHSRAIPAVVFLLLAFSLASRVRPQAVEPMTNKDVMEMTAAGLSEAVVTAKIQAAKSANFDTSVDGLKALKDANVPDSVVQAMILKGSSGAGVAETPAAPAAAAAKPPADPNDPLAPHDEAVYVMENGKMLALEASRITQDKTSGMGTMMITGGLSKMKQKAEIQHPHSGVVVSSTRPVFYFYIENDAATGLTAMMMPAAKSADDYALARMESKKETREVALMSVGGASGMKGPSELRVTSTQVAKGVYKVIPDKPLAAGEYCFLQTSGNPQMPSMPGHVFTFQIAGK